MFAVYFDEHTERMPHGIVELADLMSRFLFDRSRYHLNEQLHLAEFAALEIQKMNDGLDMSILVRKKPFRGEKQGGFINDVDSEDETAENPTLCVQRSWEAWARAMRNTRRRRRATSQSAARL